VEIRHSNAAAQSKKSSTSKRSVVKGKTKSKADARSVPPLKTFLLDPEVRAFFGLIHENQDQFFRQKAIALLEKRIATAEN